MKARTHETLATNPAHPASPWTIQPLDPSQAAPRLPLPVSEPESIDDADEMLRSLLCHADKAAQKAIERRGRDECFRHDVAKLRLARNRLAELLLFVPPSDL
jgi:hypothetical protein